MMEIVPLHGSNFRDPATMLREIADAIENGAYGEVGTLGLVVMGDTLEVWSAGIDADGPSAAVVLYAGFMRLTSAIEGHGRQ